MELEQHIEKLLCKNPKFYDNNGILCINKVLKSIEKLDQDLLDILIKDTITKKVFFTKIDNIDILEQNKLINLFFKQIKKIHHHYNFLEHKQMDEDKKLIIKKDNLIVLHNLKSIYAKRIKLIYIDLLYDRYRNDFTHSNWLTFMKSYLEIAKDFLNINGVIFVQIDDEKQIYLEILIKKIFLNKNYKYEIIWGRKAINSEDKKRVCIAIMLIDNF